MASLMTSAPHSLGEVLDVLEHALRTYPDFRWHGAEGPCPNGRYFIDHVAHTIWLDRSLDGAQTFRAFIAACVELDAGSAYTQNVPGRHLAN